VFAHIIAMAERGEIACDGELAADAEYGKAG